MMYLIKDQDKYLHVPKAFYKNYSPKTDLQVSFKTLVNQVGIMEIPQLFSKQLPMRPGDNTIVSCNNDVITVQRQCVANCTGYKKVVSEFSTIHLPSGYRASIGMSGAECEVYTYMLGHKLVVSLEKPLVPELHCNECMEGENLITILNGIVSCKDCIERSVAYLFYLNENAIREKNAAEANYFGMLLVPLVNSLIKNGFDLSFLKTYEL